MDRKLYFQAVKSVKIDNKRSRLTKAQVYEAAKRYFEVPDNKLKLSNLLQSVMK